MRQLQLVLSSLLLASLVSACGENPPTEPDRIGVELSASPSPSPTASPFIQASPSGSPTASPEPSSTPFPTASTEPSPSPLATASPVATPSPESQPVKLTFRARVITEAREVLPVKSTFRAEPYDLPAIQQELAAKNKVELRPQQPQAGDAKYQLEEKICNSNGCSTETRVDNAAYQADFDYYLTRSLPEWEGRAYQGLDQRLKLAADGRESLSFSTDINGEANLTLLSGRWYITGTYTAGNSAVRWESVPFDITAKTRAIELTR